MRKISAAALAISIVILASGCSPISQISNPSGSNSAQPSSQVSQPQSSTNSENSTDPTDESFTDGVLKSTKFDIKITKHKVIKAGQKGNEYGEKPVIAIWYDITNKSDDAVDPMNFLYVFSAFQDNNPNSFNELEVGALPDDTFLDSQTEKIKKGGTVKNAVAYELDDLKTPVELVASSDLSSKEIGRMAMKIK